MDSIILCGFFQSVILIATCHTQKLTCKQSLTTLTGSRAPKSFCSGDLVFEDEFEVFDTSVWMMENNMAIGGRTKEFQWYVKDLNNAYVDEESIFHIKPTLTADIFGEEFLYSGNFTIPENECTQKWLPNGCNKTGSENNIINPIRSVRMHTQRSFAFKYGTIEIRAKIPTADWLFPALWLMPQSSVYGKWPISGEIDIMESRGNRELFSGTKNVGVGQVSSTLHFGPWENVDAWRYAHLVTSDNQGFNDDFHTYKLVWTPNSLQFFIDGSSVGVFNANKGFFHRGNFTNSNYTNPWAQSSSLMAPFDQEFYIIINLAVGGTSFFSDSFINKPLKKPWRNNSTRPMADFWENRDQWLPTWFIYESDSSHFLIDYVRVWAL